MHTKQNLLRISVVTCLIILSGQLIFSQEKVGKEIHETYPVNENTKLQITNKYGNVDIRDWDKKSIEVTVQIKLFDVDDKKAEELLNMIHINRSVNGSTIVFETEFDNNFGKGLLHINNGDKKFEIDYIVNMPDYIPLTLSNKYGNIFIDKLTSLSSIDLKYGNLKANDISSVDKDPMSALDLGYSEANIETCSWLKITIKYSKIKISESKALIFVSKYSKIFVDRGSSIVSDSRYDSYEIGSIANFVTQAQYGHFYFKSVGKKLHVETSYTDIKVGYVPASFELIKIINQYGTYKIGIEDGASYKLDGIAKYGNISYPDKSKVNRFQQNTQLQVDGFVGTNKNSTSKVEIDTKYGSINLNP